MRLGARVGVERSGEDCAIGSTVVMRHDGRRKGQLWARPAGRGVKHWTVYGAARVSIPLYRVLKYCSQQDGQECWGRGHKYG